MFRHLHQTEGKAEVNTKGKKEVSTEDAAKISTEGDESAPGTGKGQRESDPLSVKIQEWSRFIIDVVICVCLVLMIAVMPFYFEDGYVHIATDKAVLCRRINRAVFRILIPALAVYFGSSLTVFLQERKGRLTKAVWLEQLRIIWKRVTLTDKFMALYGVVLIVSYLCSDYKETALWGAGNGWYIGFLPQLMLVGTYFFTAKLWRPRRSFFYLLFPASAAVFLLGYLNRFSFYPIAMETRSPDYFISTIGHINWYCGYAVTVFFAGMAFVWQKYGRTWQRILLYGYLLLGFGTLVTQGSTSGIVTLGIMLLVLFVMSAGNGEKMCSFFAVTVLLSAACLFTALLRSAMPERLNRNDEVINMLTTGILPIVMAVVSLVLFALFYILNRKGAYPQKCMSLLAKITVVSVSCLFALSVLMMIVNTIYPGSLGGLSENPVFTFSNDWGSGRGGTWKAGAMCFWEQDLLHKLVGVGPDAMAAYLYQGGSDGLHQLLDTAFKGLTLTNAHNEWLTVLADTGILGLVCFGGAMVTAIGTFLKKSGKSVSAEGGGRAVYCACGFSLLAYTLNNIFSFQQTVSLTTMMLILGVGMAFLREEGTNS